MKIFCIGRNYVDHVKELSNAVPTEPVIFMKPITALHPIRNYFYIPEFSNDVHYEAELVIQINNHGRSIEEQFAHKYYNEYTLGLDLTARDVQKDLKSKGLPWEIAKGFDFSAHLGDFMSLKNQDINDIDFELKINGNQVQIGNSKDMIFNCNQLVAHISKYFTLNKGDVIFTGTPAGVGPIKKGDTLEGYIGQNKMFTLDIK